MNITKSLLSSSSVLYVLIRYCTYSIQFINSFLLAKYLGVYNFGIYGFILLVLQYLSYLNFGISDALNTEYTLNSNKKDLSKIIWNVSWSMNIIILSFISLISFWILYNHSDIFIKYKFASYGYYVIILGIIDNINKLYSIFYRLHGKLFKLNIQQLLPNLLVFIGIVIMKSNYDIKYIIVTMIVSNLIALIIYNIDLPEKPCFYLNSYISKKLFIRGINLLIYSLSFSFITVIANTLVSKFYNVSYLGIYSYANTLCNAIVMAGGAFLFVFYPKILNKLGTYSINETSSFLNKMKNTYVICSDLLIVLSILFIPIIPQFIIGYNGIIDVFCILMSAKMITNSIAGYSTLLIAKSQENRLTFYGFISILIILLGGYWSSKMNLSINVIALWVFISSFVYTFLIMRYGYILLNNKVTIKSIIFEILDTNRLYIISSIFIYSFIYNHLFILYTGVIIYTILNYKKIRVSIEISYQIISNKNILNFK